MQPDRKPATTDAEALALAKTMMAYTGKFDLAPDHYTVHLEFSSAQRNLDQSQVRYYQIDGDKMTVRTAVHPSPVEPHVQEQTTLTLVREH